MNIFFYAGARGIINFPNHGILITTSVVLRTVSSTLCISSLTNFSLFLTSSDSSSPVFANKFFSSFIFWSTSIFVWRTTYANVSANDLARSLSLLLRFEHAFTFDGEKSKLSKVFLLRDKVVAWSTHVCPDVPREDVAFYIPARDSVSHNSRKSDSRAAVWTFCE